MHHSFCGSGETRSNALWGKREKKSARPRFRYVLLVLLLFALVPAAAAAQRSERLASISPALQARIGANPQATFHVIVEGRSGTSSRELARLIPHAARHRFSLISGIAARLTGKEILRTSRQAGVAAITEDVRVKLQGDPSRGNPKSEGSRVWKRSAGLDGLQYVAGSSAPTVAIVDSGVDSTNPALAGHVAAQVTKTQLLPNSPGDGRGHGTFVAGLLRAAAPSSDIVSLDVMDDNGMALTSDVIAAADWILQNKATYNIRVANFSLMSSVQSSFTNDPLDKAVERLWFNGIVVVAAAGNYAVDGQPSGVLYAPANDPFVITVGASDTHGTPSTNDDSAAPWSAYGYTADGFLKPDISAPGRHLVGPVPKACTMAKLHPERLVDPTDMWMSGTSFATPIVAGVAADVLALHPTWTPDQVKGALMLSARVPKSKPGWSLGVGLLSANRALSIDSPPNPNLALDAFLVPDPSGSGNFFDAASWAESARANASWASASWSEASWAAASWSVASWSEASWASASWAAASWAEASWAASATPLTSWANNLWVD